jgi:hypothetical protein
MGGVFTKDIGCRGHWDIDFKNVPQHAVTRGVKPVEVKGDGWLYNLHFADNITPLLAGPMPDKSRTSADAKSHAGRDEIVAWAFERGDGGRAFAFTGCDLHKNWLLESERKLVVNGILWSAHVEIPTGGAPVDFQLEELNRHLDEKRATAKPAGGVK